MNDFILSLVKYTAIFICFFYSYAKLLRLKLKVWDLFEIPLFIALSVVLHFIKTYIKILVPIGFLIFGIVFLFLRFRKTVYETITVSTISLGISIAIYVFSYIVSSPITLTFTLIKMESLRFMLAQIIVSLIQVICVILLFRIRRFQSGVNPKGETATFEILLFFSVVCIFTMMLFYTDQSLYELVLLVTVLCGLLLILWWRRHITYNYREAVKRQEVKRLEGEIAEYEINTAADNLQIAVYAKAFHYLNKAIPDCVYLAERAATNTGNSEERDVCGLLKRIMREMNIANEKCSFKNIPQTGVDALDATIYNMYTAAENKKLKVSVEISADVKSWFGEGKLDKYDIHTLLDYLCDNAVIAALSAPDAKAKLEFGETQIKEPLIRVYDSGKQFDEEVLAKLGKEQITTRAGGNRIGLFTVFEILQSYGASFTLYEEGVSFGFTKCIEIAFDGKSLITVRTSRESVAAACAERRDIAVEMTDNEILRDGTDG